MAKQRKRGGPSFAAYVADKMDGEPKKPRLTIGSNLARSGLDPWERAQETRKANRKEKENRLALRRF